MELLLIGIVGYAAWQYIEFNKFKDTFTLKLTKVAFDFNRSLKESFKNVWLNITVNVTNPTQLAQTLQNVNVSVSYQNKVVGTLQSNTAITLNNGTNVYILPIALNTINLFSSATEAYNAIVQKRPIELNLTGNFKIGSYTIPLNEKIKVS